MSTSSREGASAGDAEEAFRIGPEEFQRRKDYLRLSEEDAILLRALLPAAEGACASYLDRFYGEMERFEETRSVLEKSSIPHDKLREIHGDQLLVLLGGQYDLAYAQGRLRIGAAHHKVGLKPEWYVGAYSLLLADLLPGAWKICGGDVNRFIASVEALFKVVLLDIELAISAYFHSDHEKLRLFAKVFESDLEAVLITDLRGTIVHASHMTGTISGYAAAELTKRHLSLLHSPQNSLDFADVWQEVELDGTWHGDIWHRHANGGDYLARMSIAAVRGDDERVTHYVVEYSDATEAWEAEQSLRTRTEELARSNRELEQFAYVASHDLQEPLRMVASYTQLLARRYQGKLDADADEFIAFAVDGATRMQVLINDLLKLSRVGTRGKPFAAVDLGGVANAALANLDVALRESGGTVTIDPMPRVTGDETQLIQLLQNLIGNALKFRRPDAAPQVRVESKRFGHGWKISVWDNGIGIAPEYFDRIFVIFQRLHGKSEYPGTGIGLALCKKIVERHGGSIQVESQPHQGTAFHFTIPDSEVAHDGH
ncbi:MAG: ATP-binding protein [Rhodocyclaceae bacterium]|nr:ATP-binding protein [Rhodocyclaceae bacterium]